MNMAKKMCFRDSFYGNLNVSESDWLTYFMKNKSRVSVSIYYQLDKFVFFI